MRQVIAALCLAIAYVVGLALLLANLLAGHGLAGMQIVVLLLVLMLWPASRLAHEFAGAAGPPMATRRARGLAAPLAVGFIAGVAAMALIEAAASVQPGVAVILALVIGCSAALLLVAFGRRSGPPQ